MRLVWFSTRWDTQGTNSRRLTDPTAQRFEVALLRPPRESVVVDFAHGAGVGTSPALRPLSVA